jgi:DNA-binding XRE family transcriptional regulator
MVTKSWEEFLADAGVSPRRQAESEQRASGLVAALKLGELRKARELTQQEVAAKLGISQASVSELENRADMLISTLRRFIAASGGELRIVAHYPEADILIEHLAAAGNLKPPRAKAN